MSHLIHALTRWVLHQYARQRFLILFSVVFVEEAGVPLPLPGDSLVMFAGGQTHKTIAYDVAVIALSSLAVFLGSSVLYFISWRGGRALLHRYGKFVHLHPERVERVEGWFRRHGVSAVILGRLIPGVRIPTTIMAGLSNVSYRVFALASAIASVIWSVFYFFIGVAVQREWGLLTAVFSGLLDQLSDDVLIVWAAVIALSVLIGARHVSRRVRRGRQRMREKDHLTPPSPTPAQPVP